MNKRLAKYRQLAMIDQQTFPIPGPELPEGWLWVYQRPGASAPQIAMHPTYPLTVRQVGASWRAEIGSKRLRVDAQEVYGLTGVVLTFHTPQSAAFTVTAHWHYRQTKRPTPEYVEIDTLPGLRWQVEGAGETVSLRPAFVAIVNVPRVRIRAWGSNGNP
jgi:hypothetical protein